MDALRDNLTTIAQTNAALAARISACARGPAVVAFQSPDGAWSFRVDGRLYTSARDPGAEGRTLASHFGGRAEREGARRLVLFGLVPYALGPLLACFEELLVVEPSLELVRAVCEHIDLRDVLPRVALLAGDEVQDSPSHPLLTSATVGVLEAHAPARLRAPRAFDAIARCFRAGGETWPLDVAVIPPSHGGSLPVAQATARALRELGHRVRSFELEPLARAQSALGRVVEHPGLAPVRAELNAALVRIASVALVESMRGDPPDLVFALAQAPLDARALAELRKLGVPTALWFCEDFRVMTSWRELAPLYDVVFHLQPDAFARPLADAGATGFPLPMAFDPGVHKRLELEPDVARRYDADLSFVGAAYHNRLRFLPGLFDLGLRVYGVGWPAEPAWDAAQPERDVRQSPEACNQIFNATRVNLNLHSSPWAGGVNPAGDYLNPRTFELAGAGSFQLVDERSDLARSFAPGEEIETFRDLEECRRKVRHFLDHPEEARARAAKAARRALLEHTYRVRLAQAVEVLRAGPRPPRARARAQPLASVGREEAARRAPELVPLLDRLEPARPLDAKAVDLMIARGEGALLDAEKYLMFMREAAAEAVFQPGARGA